MLSKYLRTQHLLVIFLFSIFTSCSAQDPYEQENCDDYVMNYSELTPGDSILIYEGCRVDGKSRGTHFSYNLDGTISTRAEYGELGHTKITYRNDHPTASIDSIVFVNETGSQTRYIFSKEDKLLTVETKVKIRSDTYYETIAGDRQNGHIYNRKNQKAQLSVYYRDGVRYPELWTDTMESIKVEFYFNKNDETTNSTESHYFFAQEITCDGGTKVIIKDIQDTVPLILLSEQEQIKLCASMRTYKSRKHVTSERSGTDRYSPIYLAGRTTEKELQQYFIDHLNRNLIVPSVFGGFSTNGSLAIYFNASGEVVGVHYSSRDDGQEKSFLSKQVIANCYLTLPSELVPIDGGRDAIYVTSFEYDSSLH
jgi:hypothetical protein